MPSIATQKSNLRGIINKAVMMHYELSCDGKRKALTFGLLFELTARMTLKELHTWNLWMHENILGKEKK